MGLFTMLTDKIHTSCKKSKDTSLPFKPYKDGRYNISQHCVDRMNERRITKGEVHINLHTKPIKKTKIKYDKLGRPSYERYSDNKICTRINPKNYFVSTVSRFHTKEYGKIKKQRRKNYGKIFFRSRCVFEK